MSEQEKKEQGSQSQTGTGRQTDSTAPEARDSATEGGRHRSERPSADDELTKEDERTGEGTGARAGEYS